MGERLTGRTIGRGIGLETGTRSRHTVFLRIPVVETRRRVDVGATIHTTNRWTLFADYRLRWNGSRRNRFGGATTIE